MAPFLCAAWFLRKDTLPPGHTLQTYLPPKDHASFAHATSLHRLATEGIPDLVKLPADKQRSCRFFPDGTLPTVLRSFLVSRAGVSRTAVDRVMTALAATSLWGYHEAELQKRLITSSLLQKQGIPPPMFDPRPMNITSPCECCAAPTPSLWLLRVSARDLPSQSKDSCINTLHRASETYMKTHNVRLGRHRGPLMQSTHPYVRSRYLSQGAAVCWTCALPTFIDRLHTADRPLPPSSPPLPEDQGKRTLALYLRRYVLVEIRGPNARNAILNHLETAHVPAPYSPQLREKPGFQPLQQFLYEGKRLIPYAVTPPHTPTTNVRGTTSDLVVWCLPAPETSKKLTTPVGPYHEKFCSVPFADYLSATRPARPVPPQHSHQPDTRPPPPPFSHLNHLQPIRHPPPPPLPPFLPPAPPSSLQSPPPSAGGRLLRARTTPTHDPPPQKRLRRTNTTATATPTAPPPPPPPDPINPWQYCNLCWERGNHFAQHCPHPPSDPPRPCPQGFHTETQRLKPSQNARLQIQKRKRQSSTPEHSNQPP